LLKGEFADGIGHLDGDPSVGREGTARVNFKLAQSIRALVLEAKFFDHLIESRIGKNGSSIGSLSKRHLGLTAFPLGIDKLAEGGLQDPRGALRYGASGECIVIDPAPEHGSALG
jgi:hypothetical protein